MLAVLLLTSTTALALTNVDAMNVAAVTPASTSITVYAQGVTNAVSWRNEVQNSNTSEIVGLDLVFGTEGPNGINDITMLYTLNPTRLPYPATTCFTWTPASNLTVGPNVNYTITWMGYSKTGELLSENFATWFRIASGSTAPPASICPDSGSPAASSAMTSMSVSTTSASTVAPSSAAMTTIAAVASVSPAAPSTKSSADKVFSLVALGVLSLFLMF